MNPELANYLAWLVVFLFGAGILVLAFLGLKYLASNLRFNKPSTQEGYTKEQLETTLAKFIPREEPAKATK